jgi:hypothetical protein
MLTFENKGQNNLLKIQKEVENILTTLYPQESGTVEVVNSSSKAREEFLFFYKDFEFVYRCAIIKQEAVEHFMVVYDNRFSEESTDSFESAINKMLNRVSAFYTKEVDFLLKEVDFLLKEVASASSKKLWFSINKNKSF